MISAKPYLRATCPFSTVFYPYPQNMSNSWTYYALSVHFSPTFGQVDVGRLVRRFVGLKIGSHFLRSQIVNSEEFKQMMYLHVNAEIGNAEARRPQSCCSCISSAFFTPLRLKLPLFS